MFRTTIPIEKNKRFSECVFWKMQREYFDKQGIEAWVDQVPFYITSNPFIAYGYANLAVQFARDWVKKYPESKKHPFYVLELGTGTGRFSYYVIKRIKELQIALGLEDISIKYLMSDFTPHNIKYWESHPALQPYVKENRVEFALYNMEDDKPINLVKQNKTLSSDTLVNPLTVFGNYIFDTVSHDMFSVKDGKLYELLVTLTTEKSNMQNTMPVDYEKIQINYHPHEINESYYPEKAFNQVLKEYKEQMHNTHLLFPVGGLRAVEKLIQLANNKLFMVSSDKGYSTLESQDYLNYPRPSFHGSFSMMVNFHAIARYFKHIGGDYVLQSSRDGIKTCAFTTGFQLSELHETHFGCQQFIEDLSPADYFTLHSRVRDHFQEYTLEPLASHLAFAQWDPHIFMKIKSKIFDLLEGADPATLEFLSNHMYKIRDNFYYMPKADNVVFEIAVFFHRIKNYVKALEYYQEAEKYLGENFSLTYNRALCLYFLDRKKEALVDFERSVQLNPESKEAKEWIEHVSKSEI